MCNIVKNNNIIRVIIFFCIGDKGERGSDGEKGDQGLKGKKKLLKL